MTLAKKEFVGMLGMVLSYASSEFMGLELSEDGETAIIHRINPFSDTSEETTQSVNIARDSYLQIIADIIKECM